MFVSVSYGLNTRHREYVHVISLPNMHVYKLYLRDTQ